jgi:hypothetical protein
MKLANCMDTKKILILGVTLVLVMKNHPPIVLELPVKLLVAMKILATSILLPKLVNMAMFLMFIDQSAQLVSVLKETHLFANQLIVPTNVLLVLQEMIMDVLLVIVFLILVIVENALTILNVN